VIATGDTDMLAIRGIGAIVKAIRTDALHCEIPPSLPHS
jgi:hypothetical protein